MTEHFKAPEIIQLSSKQMANLSDAQFKTLVIRMLTELVECGRKLEEKVKAMKSEIKENTGNQQWWEGNWDSDQQFGAEGRNKHSTKTEWRNKNSKTWGEA